MTKPFDYDRRGIFFMRNGDWNGQTCSMLRFFNGCSDPRRKPSSNGRDACKCRALMEMI